MPDDNGQHEDEKVAGENTTPTFSESLAAAAQQSGIRVLKPGEAMDARAVLGAIGGIRGVIESVVPGIAFLVVYLVTHNAFVSVLVPVIIALGLLVARIVTKSSPSSAIAGAVLLAFSAFLTLRTNDATNNFVPGIIINAVSVLILLGTLIARWPLIGLLVGFLYGDPTGWRKDPVKRRTLTGATWLWVGLFAIRLAIELPLYFAHATVALGIVRLITSVPLYAVVLWVTWLLVRGTYAGEKLGGTGDDEGQPTAT